MKIFVAICGDVGESTDILHLKAYFLKALS